MERVEQNVIWRVMRDSILTGVGVFMLLHETLTAAPRFMVLLVGLVVLAGPATIRAVVTGYFSKAQK
jgi:hypothetical protein